MNKTSNPFSLSQQQATAACVDRRIDAALKSPTSREATDKAIWMRWGKWRPRTRRVDPPPR